MWLAKLKKKKAQYFLLGIIFVIAICMICVGTVVTVTSGNFSAKYYDGDETPDIFGITTNEKVVDKFDEFYKSKENEVRNYNNYDIFSISTNLNFNNKNNDALMSFVIPIDDKDELSNKVIIKDGDKDAKAPKEGEMWISSTTANLKDIQVGDKAKIINGNGETLEYKISAIVNDSNQSSTAIGLLLVYVNEKERNNLGSLPKANMLTLNCDGKSDLMINELIEYINEPLAGVFVDKNMFILSATTNASIIGGIGLITAVILVIILILILRSNIKNNILKEYKSIGIYKAMGYSSKKIKRIYMYGYEAVSMIASLVGIVIALPIVSYICNIAFKNVGAYKIDVNAIAISLVIFIIFNLIVYFNVNRVLKCVNKIKPVEAINIGVTSSKKKLKKALIKNNSSSVAMAINDMYKYKSSNLITLVVFILVFYISTFFLNIAYSMNNLEDNYYQIFGTAKADITIAAPSDIENSIEEVKEYLDKDNRINDYYLWDVVAQGRVVLDIEKYEIPGGMLMATIYNKLNEEDFSIVQGVNPRNKNEVALSTAIMQTNKLSLGDYINIKIDDEEKEFLIVGSFASMMSNGQTLRLTSDIFEDSIGNVAFVNLNNIEDYNSLKEDLNKKFDGITVEKVYSPLKDAASQVVETSVPISIVLLVGALIFGIFNIINILIINNIDNRKNYGIMKSLGFTSRYIKNRNNFRIMILAVGGGSVGTMLTILTSSGASKMAMGFDISKINLNMTLVLVVITFILIIITLHICNKSINKISTVELIKE